jgi:hypothetical protein
MGEFVLIACVGHCGSKWLATVLNRPQDGMICMHEGRVMAMEKPWHVAFQTEWDKGVDAPEFAGFWRHVRRSLKNYDVVGDANDWTPYIIPEVHKHQPVSRIIYLVRNGIQTMNSVANASSSWHQFGDASWPIDSFLHRYWELMEKPGKDWAERTRWEKLCVFWKLNWHMVKWLSRELPSDVWLCPQRLEDLTANENPWVLRELMQNFGLEISDEELQQLQAQDINRKVKGNRDPAYIWSQWTEEQREAFLENCGEEMAAFGYEIPELPKVDPVTIFTIPRQFEGPWDRIQRNAIGSWERMQADEIVLFTEDSDIGAVSEDLGWNDWLPIVKNEQGTPLVSDAFQQMRDHDGILAYFNTDCIFLDDLMPAVQTVASAFDKFLMIGRRYDLPVTELLEFSEGWQDRMRKRTQERGRLHSSWGVEWFIWRGVDFSEMPPFAVGRVAYDNWIVAHALTQEVPVIDCTSDVLCIHQDHTRGNRRSGDEASKNLEMMGVKGCGVDDATWTLADGKLHEKKYTVVHDTVTHGKGYDGLYVCTTWGESPTPRYWRGVQSILAWAVRNKFNIQYADVHGKFGIAHGHNELHDHFLASDKEYMLHLDSDALIVPESIERLAGWQKPVVSALCFRRTPVYAPVVYREAAQGGGWKQDFDWIRDFLNLHLEQLHIGHPTLLMDLKDQPLVQVQRCGAHCLLIHRDVLESIQPPWFEALYDGGGGSDFDFCRKILEAGFPIYCDLSVIAGHLQGDYCTGPLDWLVWDQHTEYSSAGWHALDIRIEREGHNGNDN